MPRDRRQAPENARVQATIGFRFASHWLRKWREFCQRITERSDAKSKKAHSINNHSSFEDSCVKQ